MYTFLCIATVHAMPKVVVSRADQEEGRCEVATCCATGADHNVIGGQLFGSRQPKVAGLLIVDAPWPHIGLHLSTHAVAHIHTTYMYWALGGGGKRATWGGGGEGGGKAGGGAGGWLAKSTWKFENTCSTCRCMPHLQQTLVKPLAHGEMRCCSSRLP